MNKKLIVGIAVVACVLLVGGVALAGTLGVASARAPNPARPQARARATTIVYGWLDAVHGASLVLNVTGAAGVRGSRVETVTTTSNTTYFVQGVVSPTIADIKTNDRVAVLVDRTVESATLTAKSVAVLPAPNAVTQAGVISKLTPSGFSLTNARGVVLDSITVSNTTKVIVPGQASTTLGDLKDGDTVFVHGTPVGNKTLHADWIVVRPLNNNNTFAGLVVAVNGAPASIVMWTRAGDQLTVDVSNAVVFDQRNPGAGIGDITVGQTIVVIGTRSADHVSAQLISHAPLAGVRQPVRRTAGRMTRGLTTVAPAIAPAANDGTTL